MSVDYTEKLSSSEYLRQSSISRLFSLCRNIFIPLLNKELSSREEEEIKMQALSIAQTCWRTKLRQRFKQVHLNHCHRSYRNVTMSAVDYMEKLSTRGLCK